MNRLACMTVLASALFAALPAQAQTFDPTRTVDALEGVGGVHAGARRSFAKGYCASGYFVGNKEGKALSSSLAFNGDKHPVQARFSVGGGNPKANDKGKTPRGLALQIYLPDNQDWLMANLNAPVFFVEKPETVAPFLEARKPDPATGKPDAEKVKAFNEANPDVKPQMQWFASNPAWGSFAGQNYWGVHAFKFVNGKNSTFVKWVFEPASGLAPLTDDELKAKPDQFLAEELRGRVAKAPVVFNFNVQIAEKGDNLTSPIVPLPDARKKVTVAQLVIDKVEADGEGACLSTNFNPMIVPKGVEIGPDPMIPARASAYAVSQGRRLAK